MQSHTSTPDIGAVTNRLDEAGGAVRRPRARVSVWWLFPVPFLVVGGALLSAANETLDAFFAPYLFLLTGLVLVTAFFPGRAEERRVFILSFTTCIFVAGLAQLYMKTYFGSEVGVTDATSFYERIFQDPPFYTFDDLASVPHLGKGVPLAIYVWQRLFYFFTELGFDFGIYIGVLFNALMVALTGTVTVNTARILFGDDDWRLRRVRLAFALCGMFWLFGAIFLRDCFALLFNAVALWALVHVLKNPRLAGFLLACVLVGLATLAIYYLRKKSVVVFGLFVVLAFFCWYWRGQRGPVHLLATLMIPLLLFAGATYVTGYLETSADYASYAKDRYEDYREAEAGEESLGMALVVNQPLPVRAVLGTGTMLVFPIPLWGYLGPGVTEYNLIKTWQGVFLVCLMPLVFIGGLDALRAGLRAGQEHSAELFLALYAVFTTVIVAVSSLETRHHGQFMPAFLLLAAAPDTRDVATRKRVQMMALLWIAVVMLVHLAWAIVRYF